MAASRHSYVRFYPSDWLAGTARMSGLTRLLYFEVCLHNWAHIEPMSRADQAIVFADEPDFEARLATLMKSGKLQRTRGGGLFNDRAMSEGRWARDRREIAIRSGQRGAEIRKENSGLDRHPSRVARPNQNQNQNQNQKRTPHTPHGGDSVFDLEPPPDTDEAWGFETWWREYPNKEGKASAEKAFGKALDNLGGSASSKIAQLHFSLLAQKRVWLRKGVGGKYIPRAATWLNQSRWTDDAVVAEAQRKIAPRPDTPEPEVSPASPRPAPRPCPECDAPVGMMHDDGCPARQRMKTTAGWSPEDDERG